MKEIDKSNGYIFASIDESAVEFSKIAVGPVDWDYYRYPLYQLKFMLLCLPLAKCLLELILWSSYAVSPCIRIEI